MAGELIFGEFKRSIDDRFRISIPMELIEKFENKKEEWILTKERTGCLSLWSAEGWQEKFDKRIEVLRSKLSAGDFDKQIQDVQLLGRLLSTRHKRVQIKNKSRLTIPEGFREFLASEIASEAMIVGAAVCIEIWRMNAWIEHLEQKMPEFQDLLGKLS